MQAIVLRFDYTTSTKIEHLQKQANAASLDSTAMLPPHMTLQAFEQTDPADLKKALAPWAEQSAQLPLEFTSLGFFKQQGVFYTAPAFTDALKDFHQSVNLAASGFTGQQDNYLPDRWVPHATITKNIAAPFWGPMFARLSMEFEPFSGKAVALECWSIAQGKAQNDWSIFLSE
ncbi:MAG TPA: 2'-5' RNA ligase family protein [Planococcus sp. (in: firmicutes)]|nr:2'-5' RNA ligase family protein [Planococcus sp. (in: firmicutes)]